MKLHFALYLLLNPLNFADNHKQFPEYKLLIQK